MENVDSTKLNRYPSLIKTATDRKEAEAPPSSQQNHRALGGLKKQMGQT